MAPIVHRILKPMAAARFGRVALRVRWVLCLFALAALGVGCSWRSKDGTRHALILGIGLVSTSNQPGVAVTDIRCAGLLAGTQCAGAGVLQFHSVAINPTQASNTVVSIRSQPFSLRVTNWAVGTNQISPPQPDSTTNDHSQ